MSFAFRRKYYISSGYDTRALERWRWQSKRNSNSCCSSTGNSRWEEQTGNTHDDNSTQGTTIAVVTQGTSRGEEQTGNSHDDNFTQGATAEIVVNGNNYFEEETGDNLSDLTKYGM